MLSFDEAVAALPGGRFESRSYRAACPAHGGRKRNLSVWPDEHANARFKCWSHGCATRNILAALMVAPASAKSAPCPTKRKHADDAERSRRALEIWRECGEPRGTIVDDYLFSRGFTGEMPNALCAGADPATLVRAGIRLAIPPSIRFHPRLWYMAGVYLPAMVAGIENLDGRIVGVHRTYLKPDGTGKAEIEPNKKVLGRLCGCAVRLSAGALALVICEGIETGLSILQTTGLHVWAALGTSNLGKVELPDFVREIIIAADNDEPGMKAARAAAEFYRSHVAKVRIIPPVEVGGDWNDVARRGARAV